MFVCVAIMLLFFPFFPHPSLRSILIVNLTKLKLRVTCLTHRKIYNVKQMIKLKTQIMLYQRSEHTGIHFGPWDMAHEPLSTSYKSKCYLFFLLLWFLVFTIQFSVLFAFNTLSCHWSMWFILYRWLNQLFSSKEFVFKEKKTFWR